MLIFWCSFVEVFHAVIMLAATDGFRISHCHGYIKHVGDLFLKGFLACISLLKIQSLLVGRAKMSSNSLRILACPGSVTVHLLRAGRVVTLRKESAVPVVATPASLIAH